MLKSMDKATVYTGKACEKLSPKPVALCVHDEELEIPGDAPAFTQLIKLSNSQDTLPFTREDCNSNGVRVKAIPRRLITGPKPGHSVAVLGNCTRIFGFLSENSGF